MNSIKLFAFLTTLFFSMNSIAQSTENLEKLFNKKWFISIYETGGNQSPATIHDDEYTVFHADNKHQTFIGEQIMNNKWKYDAAKNELTLYSDSSDETTVMTIIALTENEFISEVKIYDGTLKIHMVARK